MARNRSLSIQLISSLIAVVTIVLLIYALTSAVVNRNHEMKGLNNRLSLAAEQLQISIATALWTIDKPLVAKLLDAGMKDPVLSAIVVKAGDTIYARTRDDSWKSVAGEPATVEAGSLTYELPIIFEGEQLGTITLIATTKFLRQKIVTDSLTFVASILLLDILLVCGLFYILNRNVLKPLKKLEIYAVSVSTGNNPLTSLENIAFKGELEVLRTSLERMVSLLQSRYFELQQETKRLSASENRYRILINTIPDLIWLKDADGVYLSCNMMFERFFGAKESEIVGKTDYDFVDKELADFFREQDQKAMTAGKPTSNEEWITFADDSHRALLDTIKTPMLDEEGNIVGVLGVGHDVTERKQAEDKIKEALVFNQQVINSAQQGIIVYDLALRYRVWNPFMEQMSGVKSADVLGKTPLEVFPFLKDSGVLERLKKILEEKSALTVEFPFHVESTGKSGWSSDTSAPLLNSTGELVGIIGIVQDLSEQRETQNQLLQAQKMESVGRLAGGVAHDFNNMLTAILGHAELGLMHLDPTHRVCTDLKEISKTAERSADLTRQLLAFARKQTVSPKVLDLNETISGMLKMLQRLIGENIQLTCQTAANLWPVKVDPSQIDQILANLCVNARDAIKDNGRITIETENRTIDANYCNNHLEAVPGDYVSLSVSDDGVGMDKETQRHIFEPFYTTKELGKGTGLGLSTVYGAVKQNNGFINIYSEQGQGTTFSIYLPREADSRNTEAAVEEGTIAQTARGQETILLVEDDPAILNVTLQMLEGQGYSVLKANSPGEALQLVGEQSGMIHLLMTDVVMPEMNGSDLAKKILASYPQIKQLFMSGYTADVIAHHGVLDEGVHFIQKPFSLQNVAAKVREVLDSN